MTTRIVKARTFRPGYAPSAITTATFSIIPVGSTPEYVVPLSIDSTGVTEVSAQLFDWLHNTVPPENATIIFQENGIYKCEMTLQLYQKKNWTIRGENATIRAFTDDNGGVESTLAMNPGGAAYNKMWPRNRRHLDMHYLVGCTILNLHVQGNKGPNVGAGFQVEFEAQHGLSMGGCVSCYIENCNVSSVRGDAWNFRAQSILGQEEGHWNVDIHINGGTFYNIGRQGIVPLGNNGLVMENMFWNGVARSWVDIESIRNTDGCLNWTLRNQVVNNVNNVFFANGAYGHRMNNILVEDCTTDSGIGVLIPPGAVKPIMGTIPIGPNWATDSRERDRISSGKVRRGSYTFRRCVVVGGKPNQAGGALMECPGAGSITVQDCHQDSQAGGGPDYFVRVSENATSVNVSGNTGANYLGDVLVSEDPSIANGGLKSGPKIVEDPNGAPDPITGEKPWMEAVPPTTLTMQYFESPIPDREPISPPYW